ncbi:MAG: pyridoxamine 5'-phosphate oxidase family protein [Chloroflexota bacterium]
MTQEDAPQRLATQETRDFSELEAEFMKRVARIVWCTVATVDGKGRPRTRILHPIWETIDGKPIGYIATGRHSHKEQHIATNPHVSLSYWDQVHEQIYIDARAHWSDAPEERQRIWDMFKAAPPPLGYDPAMIWRNGPLADDFGVLRLAPSRIEMFSLGWLMQGKPPVVWRG